MVPETVSPDSTGFGEIERLASAPGLTSNDARSVEASLGEVEARSAHAAAAVRPSISARHARLLVGRLKREVHRIERLRMRSDGSATYVSRVHAFIFSLGAFHERRSSRNWPLY